MRTRDALPEQQAFPQRSAGIPPRATAPARELEARRTAAQQVRPAASPQRAGFHAGLHPEDAPSPSEDLRPPRPLRVDVQEDDLEDTELPMRSRTTALPERTRVLPPSRTWWAHWLLWVGVLLCVMLLGWVALSALSGWWATQQDDWHYGRLRTFQIDAVVGHNADSAQHPSHFLALNLHRQVIVIELPAGDPSHALLYTAGTLLGDGQDLTPVTLSFEDRNGDGRPDLNIHLGDQLVVWLNNGEKFVSPQQR